MKYQLPPSNLFIENRKEFISHFDPLSMAIINSNDEFPKSGDSNFQFKQNADLFYLSGIDQEQSILLLFPESPNQRYNEVLFIRETNEHIAIWEGNKFSRSEAAQISGISVSNIFWLSQFESILSVCMHYAEIVYLNSNENDRYVHTVPYKDQRFARELMKKYPLHSYKRAAPKLRCLRELKKEEEINLISIAIGITGNALERVLRFVRPGVYEYEIEAEIIHEFIRLKATGHAYNPIIASGSNNCILHYNDNNKICKEGDLLLLDFGAEYANYNADLSRTIPVSGRFSVRQRRVYDAVLRIMKQACVLLKPGMLLEEYRQETDLMAESEILGLGLIGRSDLGGNGKAGTAFRKYYPHGISHFLGLDVHDIGDRYATLESGMVLTCEPGIYIRDESLGIRLENNICITSDANFDFMKGFPLEAEEIEEKMNS